MLRCGLETRIALWGTRERGILALAGVLMTEIGDDIAVEVVAWRWSMLAWLDFWNMIELFVVVLAMGVALGCKCATKVTKEKPRVIPAAPPVAPATAPLRCEYCPDRVNPNLFPYKYCGCCGASPSYHHGRCCPLKREKITLRTIGTQSQCTYKHHVLTPRFHVLPEQSAGVFFPDDWSDY